jgi:hypothetical protein
MLDLLDFICKAYSFFDRILRPYIKILYLVLIC